MDNKRYSKKPAAPMPLSDRAKIFAPFSALKGLSEALYEKEKHHIPKVTLSEEAAEEINRQLKILQPGQRVTITYYHLNSHKKGEYLKISGILSRLNPDRQTLTIADTIIHFSDLRDIIIEEETCLW